MTKEEYLNSNVVTLKLINDTDLVGEMIAFDDENIKLRYPFEIVSGVDQSNHPYAALKVYNAFGSETTLEFNRENIIFVTPTIDQIESMYTATIRGIEERKEIEARIASMTPEEQAVALAVQEKQFTSPPIN